MSENAVLIRKAQAGEKKAREVLIEQNLGLVHHIVKRFLGRGYDPEDLFQIGVIGLIKSIDKFDTSYDVKFSTYAVPLITGEIKRFLRDDGMVKVSRTLKENGMKVRYASERLFNKLNREPTLAEVAREAALTDEEVVMAMEANEQELVLNHMVLNQLISGLTQKEQKLIKLRYYQDKTQTEVARVLGISQVQVSRLEKKILLDMRQKMAER